MANVLKAVKQLRGKFEITSEPNKCVIISISLAVDSIDLGSLEMSQCKQVEKTDNMDDLVHTLSSNFESRSLLHICESAYDGKENGKVEITDSSYLSKNIHTIEDETEKLSSLYHHQNETIQALAIDPISLRILIVDVSEFSLDNARRFLNNYF